jgi:hypothetical protein
MSLHPRVRLACPSCGRADALAPTVVEELVREGDDVAVIRLSASVCAYCQRRTLALHALDALVEVRQRLRDGDVEGWERVGAVYRCAATPSKPVDLAAFAEHFQRPPPLGPAPPTSLPAYYGLLGPRGEFTTLRRSVSATVLDRNSLYANDITARARWRASWGSPRRVRHRRW